MVIIKAGCNCREQLVSLMQKFLVVVLVVGGSGGSGGGGSGKISLVL